MRRRLIAWSTLAILFAACSSNTGGTSGSTTGDSGNTTAASVTATQPEIDEAPSTTETVESTEPTSGRSLAPDFTLELGDGGSYTLSEGAKPVYLVFWAEW